MKSFYYSFITEIELLSHGDEDQRKIILNFLKNGKQIAINKKIISKTIELRKEKGLKIPDAIIVASAENIGADLYTSDKEVVKKIDSLNVINFLDR